MLQLKAAPSHCVCVCVRLAIGADGNGSVSSVLLPGILHGAGLWQLPKQLYLPADDNSTLAPNSHLKYVW